MLRNSLLEMYWEKGNDDKKNQRRLKLVVCFIDWTYCMLGTRMCDISAQGTANLRSAQQKCTLKYI